MGENKCLGCDIIQTHHPVNGETTNKPTLTLSIIMLIVCYNSIHVWGIGNI